MGWESDSMLNLTRMLGVSGPGSLKLESVRDEFEAMLDRFPVRGVHPPRCTPWLREPHSGLQIGRRRQRAIVGWQCVSGRFFL